MASGLTSVATPCMNEDRIEFPVAEKASGLVPPFPGEILGSDGNGNMIASNKGTLTYLILSGPLSLIYMLTVLS